MSALSLSSLVVKFTRVFCRPFLLVALLSAGAMAAPPEWVEGQLIVKPRAGLSAEQFEKILGKAKGQSVKHLQQINARVIKVPPQALEAVRRALSNNPNIDFVERNPLVPPSAFTPNDPSFPDQWHLSRIQAPTAWDAVTGSGITVAIVDSGVEGSHPDLTGSMVPGRNVVSNNGDTSAMNVHGTAVAGAIAATGNNATGVASVVWNAGIMPIRISNRSDGWAEGSDMVEGVLWAADHGADVVNISYDFGNGFAALNDAAQYLRNKGGLVVMSAGNNNTDYGFSDNPYIIHVSATTSSDAKASFSNFGNFVDVSAPGKSVLTVWQNGGYGWGDGTSFSSPIAAGVIALIKAANPGLTATEVETILKNSADDLGSTGRDKYFGHGRVNAAAAVQLATGGGTTPDTELPVVTITSPANGTVVSGTIPVDVTASDNAGVERVELFADGKKVGTDSTRPYAFSWNSVGKAGGSLVALTARATDAAGNVGTAGVTVTIATADTSAPVVTAPPAVTREATGPLTSVNLGTATAFDDVDGAVAVTADSTGPFAVGRHTVVWSATDSSGNTGSAQQQVTVTDTTPPEIIPPLGVTVQAAGTLTSVNLGQAFAEDLVDGTVTATPSTTGPFPVGTTVVTWRAADRAGNTASATQSVTVTFAEDITPPVITVPPNLTVEATGPLTAVNPGTAVAVDAVDGAVAVTPSGTGPFAPGVHLITWTARDAAGNAATAQQRITVRDTTPPTITAPADKSTAATGYLTAIDLGRATAYDSVSGTIQPVANPAGPYASGLHLITWTATDQAGNKAQATQWLTVLPLVSLAVDQTVSEGSTVTVAVSLSGAAPRYPVAVPYTVGGTATNPGDHDAVDGMITIKSGTTGKLVFHVVDDGITGEVGDAVVFTLQTPSGAVLGSRRKHTVTIIEDNAAPLVDLQVEQRGNTTLTVSPDNGPVLVTARVHDPNPQDTHDFDWSLTDNNLVDTGEAGAGGFSFDPQWLADGMYAVKVSVTDNGIPEETGTAEVLIKVNRTNADADRRDTDQDGIPDYLDDIADPAILQGIEGVSNRSLLVTESGLRLRLGGAALATGKYGAGITLQDVKAFAVRAGGVQADLDTALTYPGGFFDFEIAGLSQAGQSVRIVISQHTPIGQGAVYRKYHLDYGWQDFVEDARNHIASAPGSLASCPEPGAQVYQPGLHAGHYCVQLTLEDGGPNDADNRRNGVIQDPGGIGSLPQSLASGSGGGAGGGGGGGGGGCTVGTRSTMDPLPGLMALLAILGLMRRRFGAHDTQ